MTLKVIGLDIAKHVFQVHGVNETGKVVVRRKLRRADVLRWFADIDPTIVGIEACQTAHYWARELVALGHDVRLMPPQFVKPYVKSQKNDAADAEAICEAVQRPTMRFVPIKSAEQQAALLLHRTRDLFNPAAQQPDQLDPNTLCGVRYCGQPRRARRGSTSPDLDQLRHSPAGAGARDAWNSCRPVAGRGSSCPDRRGPITRLASLKRHQPTPHHDPRDRADHRECDRRDRRRCPTSLALLAHLRLAQHQGSSLIIDLHMLHADVLCSAAAKTPEGLHLRRVCAQEFRRRRIG